MWGAGADVICGYFFSEDDIICAGELIAYFGERESFFVEGMFELSNDVVINHGGGFDESVVFFFGVA